MFPPLWKAERKKEWARETERVRGGDKKREQVRMSQPDRKRNRNKENESTSQTYYYPIPAASKATLSVLIVQWWWGVLIHSGSTSWPPPSCYLWWEGTTFLPTASPLLTLSHITPYQSALTKLSLPIGKSKGAPCCPVVFQTSPFFVAFSP